LTPAERTAFGIGEAFAIEEAAFTSFKDEFSPAVHADEDSVFKLWFVIFVHLSVLPFLFYCYFKANSLAGIM